MFPIVKTFAVLSGLLTVIAQPTKRTALGTTDYRTSPGVVNDESGTGYNYAPAIIIDDGDLYRMWWCGLPPGAVGDHILYAQSTSIDGPFTSVDGTAGYQSVFEGTGIGSGHFDARHTCDPNVVKVDGTYYLYYGAEEDDGLPTTAGLATSPDGITWTRANNGQPIVTQAGVQLGNSYGAGQPAVVHHEGMFYMLFTDTTGSGSDYSDDNTGNSIYAWRSADPAFQTGVEVFLATGWTAYTDDNNRSFSVFRGASVDWQWSNLLQGWVVAVNSHSTTSTTISFLNKDNLLVRLYDDIEIQGTWTEGPGLVRYPEGTDHISANCDRIFLDVIESTTRFPPTTLRHFGLDALTGRTSC